MTTVTPTTDSIILNHPTPTHHTEFAAMRTAYESAFRALWLSLIRNIAFFRKYLQFKISKSFPTNLQIKRQEFNYSSSWNQLQLQNLIQLETRIILQTQCQILQLRIDNYYDMIKSESTSLIERLKLQHITNNFISNCPELANYHDLYNDSYLELKNHLLSTYELPTLTEEEHLEQLYNIPVDLSTTTDRKRLRADDEDKSRPSSFIPSFSTPSSNVPTLSTSSSSSSSSVYPTSSLTSSKRNTNHRTLQHTTPHSPNTKLKHITKHNLPKPSKNPTKTTNTSTIKTTSITDLSLTPASKSTHANNIKTITDQLTSLTSAVASLLSNNQTIKNAKVANPNVKKKHNLPPTTNITNTTINTPSTTKKYNLNHTPQPLPLMHLAPTLFTQPPYNYIPQPQHQTYIPHHPILLSTHLNNQHHPYHYPSDQHYIYHDQNPPYEARNHFYPHPNHG